jgi:hypothetical protein
MRFLGDERLYSRTEDCLRFLRGLEARPDLASLQARERYHLFWHGTFSLKQAFAVKSFLATQSLESSELWLWLAGPSSYSVYEENRFLQPLLAFLQVKRFDFEVECPGTPLERRPELYNGLRPVTQSDLFRFVVLYNHGGTYVDIDTMFLRDLNLVRQVTHSADEFCYRWSAHLPYGSSAVLRLRQRSETARALLERCCEINSCHPSRVLRFDENADLDLLVLPCVFFDPLWPHRDRRDSYREAPFNRFEDFFRPFGWRFRRKRRIRSYRDFFPGALAYQWHNCWGTPEDPNSYFGIFNEQFDTILVDKLGIETRASPSR